MEKRESGEEGEERQRKKKDKEKRGRVIVFYLDFCPLVSDDPWHSSEGGELVGCHF